MKTKLSAEVLNSSEYKSVIHLIEMLKRDNVLSRLNGNCIGACDLLTSMLLQNGVSARIVECAASIKNTNYNPPTYFFVGYDGFAQNEQVDVHTVVITEGKIPLLVDLSIATSLPEHTPYVITTLANDPFLLAEYEIDGIEIKYNNKKSLRLPALHQKTILQRIKEDQDLKQKIKVIQLVMYILIGMGFTNFFLNITQILMRIAGVK